eukprot:Rhum_TRINITY_DN12094_c0_g1::Rhum_TRINITY_DN12094_c0_g1_i1::g.49148::m.49148/K08829/MAK; male germ cell-associated kinase
MAEMYLIRPLFPGTSETDEIFKICSVLGTPTPAQWQDGHRLAQAMSFKFPQMVATPLSSLMPNTSNEALSIMNSLLMYEPKKRLTAQEALAHPFFTPFLAAISAKPQTPGGATLGLSSAGSSVSGIDPRQPPPQQPPPPADPFDVDTRAPPKDAPGSRWYSGTGDRKMSSDYY